MMNAQISNIELFKAKEKIIQKMNQLKLEPSRLYEVSVNYHGLVLNFISKNYQFIQQITDLVPRNWIVPRITSEFEIFFNSPLDFNLTEQSFSEEASQDCYSFEDNTSVIQRDFTAKIFGKKVFVTCQESVSDGFYNFLRWFISERLININKYVLHCSAVLDSQNNAHLFLGHSGAGKTTTTFLSKPRLVLGDDMNIVSLNDLNQVVVEAGAIGGLFNSDVGYGTTFKVKAFYWLEKSDQVQLKRCSLIETQQKILASFANICWEYCVNDSTQAILNIVNNLSEKVPLYNLYFKKDDSFWKLIE